MGKSGKSWTYLIKFLLLPEPLCVSLRDDLEEFSLLRLLSLDVGLALSRLLLHAL